MAGVIAASVPTSPLPGPRLHAAQSARSVVVKRTFSRHLRKLQTIRTIAATATTPAGSELSHIDLFDPRTALLVAAKAALQLKQRGWTIIDDLFSQEECTEYVESVWHWLQSLGTGISRSASFVRSLPDCLNFGCNDACLRPLFDEQR